MVLFDNHNHSQFSFDGSRTSVEASACAAAAAGLGGICFSDHCDHYIPPMKASFADIVPEYFDVGQQQAEITRVQETMGDRVKILKGIEKHIERGFRNESSSPKRFTNPIAKLVFIVLLCKVVSVKSNAADWFAILFQTNSIGLGRGQHRANDLAAVLHARVRRPSGRWAYLGVAGVYV